MAKRIYLSDEDIREALEKATRELRNTKFHSEDVKVTLPSPKDERKAKLVFTASAWVKMYALVHKYGTEVEWHGLVERKGEAEFLIKDILIFPHEVSSATVVSDQRCYEEWLDSLDDDTFNACRFHGHSHVNMGVTPSGVDTTYRKNILGNFATPGEDDDYFSIFIITNKKGDISGEIYDLTNNALYATHEIEFSVIELDDIKRRIKDAFHDAIEDYVDRLTQKNLTSINNKGELSFTISTDVEVEDDFFLSELISEAEGVVVERRVVTTPASAYPYRSTYNGCSTPAAATPTKPTSSLQSKRPDVEDDDGDTRQLSLYDSFEDDDEDYYRLYRERCSI